MWRSLQIVGLLVVVASGLVIGCGERAGVREFEQGLRQLERDRLIRARDYFEQSVQERPGHPGNAYALHYLGYIAWRLDDRTAARNYFERSTELNPNLFEPVLSLGALAFEEGDWIRARSLFDSAARLQPGDPRPLEYLARTYVGEGGRRDARRKLYAAGDLAPNSPRVLTSLALIEAQEGQVAEAESYLMQALEKDPDYPPALYNLARLYAPVPAQEEHAIAYFRQYLDVAPEGPQRQQAVREMAALRTGESPDQPDTRVRQPRRPAEDGPAEVEQAAPTLDDLLANARRLAEAGERERAMAHYLRLAAQARNRGERERERRIVRAGLEQLPEAASLHRDLGRHFSAQGEHQDALAAYRAAVALEPGWSSLWVLLADSAAALEQYDVALDALTRAVEAEPSDPSALWALANLYEQTGVRRRAMEAYTRFRERFPRDPRAVQAAERVQELRPTPAPEEAEPEPAPPTLPRRNVQAAREALQRGVTYQRRRDWDNALFYYARALHHNPELEPAHYNRGVIHMEQRDWAEARDAFKRSVELAPQKTTARYNLALAQYESGAPEEAVGQLDRVLRIDPNYAPAHLLLGIIYAQDETRHGRARRHYERFVALQPNDPNVSAVRAWLESH